MWMSRKQQPLVSSQSGYGDIAFFYGMDFYSLDVLWNCKFACCYAEEQKDHAIRYPYAQALLHSRIPNDWYRGMDLVRGSVESTSINPKQKKKEMYLLAVGFFRSQNYTKSEELVD
nr:mitochondrial fission 1 protein A [Tanacetum cinerariifolium]